MAGWQWMVVGGLVACLAVGCATEEGCGDGIISGLEACDEGAANADDGACTSQCVPAVCGDGLVYAGVEECDEAEANADDAACTSTCTIATCGDGLEGPGEECDFGPSNAKSIGCLTDCVRATCGDGFVWIGTEECDEGEANADDAACTSECTVARCGDGFVRAGVELCDDGNRDNGDGCESDCRWPRRRPLTVSRATVTGVGGRQLGATLASTGDVDGDGFDDVLLGTGEFRDNEPYAYLMRGPLTGSVPLTAAATSVRGESLFIAPTTSVIGGANLDEDPGREWLLRDASNEVAFYDDTVVGEVVDAKARYARTETSTSLAFVTTSDVDGDGIDDLIWQGLDEVVVLPGPFTDPVELTKPLATFTDLKRGVALADFDGDGAVDLAGIDAFTNTLLIFDGPLKGDYFPFRADRELITGLTLFEVGLGGDILGNDGASLLVPAESSEGFGQVLIFQGPVPATGTAELVARARVLTDFRPVLGENVVAPGDLNGDGRADLAVSSSTAGGGLGRVWVFYGPISDFPTLDDKADVIFETPFEGTPLATFLSPAGDIDGDGLQDLLVSMPQAGEGDGVVYLLVGSEL